MTDDEIRAEFGAMKAEFGGLKADFGELHRTVSHLEGRFTTFAEFMTRDMAEVKATLAQLVPLLARIDQKLADVPSGAEFAELKGRVEEISRRLPTTLAYTPADEKRRA